MKVSVVLTTYNGHDYVVQLLESLLAQDNKIDEVIISDDCSTDDTFYIIKDFVIKHQLYNWVVNKNEINVGFKKNFLNSMKLATGDLVFPCDQDDIWHPGKVRIFKYIMESYDNINVLFCRSVPFANDSNVSFSKIDANLDRIKLRNVKFEEEVRECYGAGHLICLRREFMQHYIDDIARNDLTFDIPFCLIAAEGFSLYELNSKLVDRRFNDKNTSGATRYK